MKLFKKLFIAPAALGLLAPMSATANELNIADVSGYSSSEEVKNISEFDAKKELAITNSRVDGIEAKFNNFEAGGFTETTSMKGVAEFLIGAASNGGSDAEEAVMFNYHWSVDLDTSFTGDDKLNVEISSGNQNGTKTVNEVLDFGEPASDQLRIEDINYTFPVGEWTVTVGDSLDASKQFPNACAVEAVVDGIDKCGVEKSLALGGDVSVSAGTELGNGWSLGLGLSALGANGSDGIFTKEGTDYYGIALGYAADNFEVSAAFGDVDSGSYYGFAASYSSDDFPTISGGIEFGNPDSGDETTQYVVGASSDLGEGTIAATLGTKQHYTSAETEQLAYDISYSYPINDSMSIKPFAYVVEQSGDNDSGIGVVTKFKF